MNWPKAGAALSLLVQLWRPMHTRRWFTNVRRISLPRPICALILYCVLEKQAMIRNDPCCWDTGHLTWRVRDRRMSDGLLFGMGWGGEGESKAFLRRQHFFKRNFNIYYMIAKLGTFWRRCGKMEYNSAIKKNGIMPYAATWMNLEWSKSDRERQISYDITYM